ncbi:1-(5-phosphoribosyl)-5-[(5-phosphoribosylamino)methylideneamino]imidazole-4-carboxamide isomerase [Deltaproteobacteria bacterium Smac51]|nr:1-(5-phosphoribosyl)-5-[(5-phosphoribosylamino)methylideneamino]imidazole-4-carboxamide isomerase [Deltaproteobacteria bacterium Smac51]
MILFPAIDLKDGKCVRLYKGRFEEQTIYGEDPAAMAGRWAEAGAKWLHLVDLDGSLGDSSANRAALEAIRKRVDLKMQLGGGIRSLDIVRRWFDLGVERLIMGTVVCENPALVEQAAAEFPGRIAVGLDAVGEDVRVRGWKESGGHKLFDVAASLKNLGAAVVIYTDVERDGTGVGPNIENTRRVAEVSGLPTIASGGVSTLEDLVALKPLGPSGVIGAISGKALYAGTLDFARGRELLAE